MTQNLTLTMPRLGETMEEGLVVGWMVAAGQPFKRGQPILELETDKTVVEFPALGDGMIDAFIAGPGDRVTVGQPIARASVASVTDWAEDKPAPEAAHADSAPTAPARAQSAAQPGDRPRATPVARRLARHSGVDLDLIPGTGRRGRIEAADVQRAAKGAGGVTAGDLRWLDLPEGRLAYSVTGTTGGAHLLIHGFAGDRSAWAQLAALLARAGQSVVLPDLPGHGATTAKGFDLATLTDAVIRLAETLPAPITLVGHSLGAAVAVLAAERLGPKVARVVLLTPIGCGPTMDASFVHGMAKAATPGEVAHLLRLLGPKGGTVSEPTLMHMAQAMSRGRLGPLAQALAADDGRQRIDLLRPLSQLAGRVPVVALFGTQDQIVSPSDAFDLPPQVAAHFLPSGHMPQWDAPRDVAEIILKGHDHA